MIVYNAIGAWVLELLGLIRLAISREREIRDEENEDEAKQERETKLPSSNEREHGGILALVK
jgi:hypothetical protein